MFTAVLFLVLLALVITATAAPKPVTITTSCNLSALKVKDVKIDGDKDGFVAVAIKSELFAHGATQSPSGFSFIGKVDTIDGLFSPMVNGLSVSSPGTNYASSIPGDVGVRLMEEKIAQKYLARKVVADFCKVPLPVAQARK